MNGKSLKQEMLSQMDAVLFGIIEDFPFHSLKNIRFTLYGMQMTCDAFQNFSKYFN